MTSKKSSDLKSLSGSVSSVFELLSPNCLKYTTGESSPRSVSHVFSNSSTALASLLSARASPSRFKLARRFRIWLVARAIVMLKLRNWKKVLCLFRFCINSFCMSCLIWKLLDTPAYNFVSTISRIGLQQRIGFIKFNISIWTSWLCVPWNTTRTGNLLSGFDCTVNLAAQSHPTYPLAFMSLFLDV